MAEPERPPVEHVDWCDHEHDTGPCRGEWAGAQNENGHLLVRFIDRPEDQDMYEVSMAVYGAAGTDLTELILELDFKQARLFVSSTGIKICLHPNSKH